jgi:pSer/pThr/pTyr-binding forkhead associated (FHA) protein
MATLIFETGPRAGERIDIDGEVVIGREGAQLDIDDPEISRRHVAVRSTADGLELEDLGSTNGTHVDGRLIAGVVALRDGARVALGETEFTVALPAAQATRIRERAADPAGTRLRPTPPLAGGPESEPQHPARPREPVAATPFGTGTRGARRGSNPSRPSVATRLWVPAAVAISSVVATAAALIAYFAGR